MNDPEVRLERLGPQHALDDFKCGHTDLDTWLKCYGLAAQQMGSARTFVLVEGNRVIGYFSLTMGSVLRAKAPGKLVRGLPYYPVGMVPLARMAVHSAFHGQGLGALLLTEALRKAVTAGEAAAARLVVLDAIDEDAARFYARYGFVAVPEHPARLYRRMKDIRRSLEAPEGS